MAPNELLRGEGERRLAVLAAVYARPRSERWLPVPRELDEAIANDAELAEAARRARERLVRVVSSRLGELPQSYLDALRDVPRERFVLPEDIDASAEDVPLSLDPEGQATVSAPHAYLLTYRLLDLGAGDHLLELGTGTGYGAALAQRIVGERGRVTTIEIDADLFARAKRLLAHEGAITAGTPRTPITAGTPRTPITAGTPRTPITAGTPPITAGIPRTSIELIHGDARAAAPEVLARSGPATLGANKIAVTYAVDAVPEPIEAAVCERGVLVAPVGAKDDEQELVRCERRNGVLFVTTHGAVRYVAERRARG